MEKFLVILEKFFELISKKFDKEGINGIVPICVFIFFIIIFLTPGYILIFLYKVLDQVNNNLIIEITTMIVINTLLFFYYDYTR